jgi:hypothetical protein
MRPGPLTRRSLLLTGAAALAAARPAVAAQDRPDATAAALESLIRREFAAAFAYRAAGDTRLAAQETEHALALNAHLEAVGTRRLLPPRDARGLDPAAARVAAVAGARERAGAAIALEQSLLDVYARALGDLYDPSTVRTAATVMASHGQHLVAHYEALARDPLSAIR